MRGNVVLGKITGTPYLIPRLPTQAKGTHLEEVEERGGNPAEMMCFVWYVLDAEEAAQTEHPNT